MNKFLRYLILILLLAGVAYAVYFFINKPVAKVEEVVTVVEAEGEKVALDGNVTDSDSVEALAMDDSQEEAIEEETAN